MPTTLTGSSISITYPQLLHVDGGLTATEKTVYGGTGVASALKVGTGSASVDNLRLDGNTISSLNANGDINLTPNGTGSVVISKLTATSGTLSSVTLNGVTIASLASDLPVADGGTGASTLTGYLKGNGTAAFTGSATIPYNDLSGRPVGEFWSTTDQTATANTATVVTFDTSASFNNNVSLTSSTRLVCAVTGVYEVTASIQFANSAGADHTATFWLRRNGTDVANSASTIVVPKTGDGGVMFATVTFLEEITVATQYFEVVWATSNAAVTIDYTAASGASPARPAIPSVVAVVKKVS
jgi:hypothetical protein